MRESERERERERWGERERGSGECERQPMQIFAGDGAAIAAEVVVVAPSVVAGVSASPVVAAIVADAAVDGD